MGNQTSQTVPIEPEKRCGDNPSSEREDNEALPEEKLDSERDESDKTKSMERRPRPPSPSDLFNGA